MTHDNICAEIRIIILENKNITLVLFVIQNNFLTLQLNYIGGL